MRDYLYAILFGLVVSIPFIVELLKGALSIT